MVARVRRRLNESAVPGTEGVPDTAEF